MPNSFRIPRKKSEEPTKETDRFNLRWTMAIGLLAGLFFLRCGYALIVDLSILITAALIVPSVTVSFWLAYTAARDLWAGPVVFQGRIESICTNCEEEGSPEYLRLTISFPNGELSESVSMKMGLAVQEGSSVNVSYWSHSRKLHTVIAVDSDSPGPEFSP
jgi:hypothetical protein